MLMPLKPKVLLKLHTKHIYIQHTPRNGFMFTRHEVNIAVFYLCKGLYTFNNSLLKHLQFSKIIASSCYLLKRSFVPTSSLKFWKSGYSFVPVSSKFWKCRILLYLGEVFEISDCLLTVLAKNALKKKVSFSHAQIKPGIIYLL